MVTRGHTLPLSVVKAKLSEIIRGVRSTGQPLVVTVDGQAAAQIVPVPSARVVLSPSEVANVRALMEALVRIPRVCGTFDAVEWMAEGRR